MTRYKGAMVMIEADDVVMCMTFLSTWIWQPRSDSSHYRMGQFGTLLNFPKVCWHISQKSFSVRDIFPICSLSSKPEARVWRTYWKEVGNVYDVNEKAVVPIFTQTLRSGEFYKHMNTQLPRSYDKLMRMANCFVEAEETNRTKRDEKEGKWS